MAICKTDSFNIEGSQWRVKWATTNEEPAGAGTFRATVHQRGQWPAFWGWRSSMRVRGNGVAVVNEDPRLFFLDIESRNLSTAGPFRSRKA